MLGFGTGRRTAVLICVAFVTAGAALPTAAAATVAPGSAYVFGSNEYGQLGIMSNIGTQTPNPTPAPLTAPAGSGTITRVALGESDTLMLTSSGTLYGFGDDTNGELGTSSPENPSSTPIAITLPGQSGSITALAAGQTSSLVATSSGQLYGFGTNKFGELGISANFGTNNLNTPTLVTLPGQSGTISSIAEGGLSTLVLTSSGQLYGFGFNEYGELGTTTTNGAVTGYDTPTRFTLPGQSGTVTQIAAGFDHGLALTSSGQLFSFGENEAGELGYATAATANPTPTLVTLPGEAGTITRIAAGNDTSFAATSGNQLYGWGDNLYGKLGTTANVGHDTDVPTEFTLPGQSGAVTEINSGQDETLVVTSSGQLYSFGDNEYGELGIAADNGTTVANPTPTPVALPAGTTIDTIGIGDIADHSVAVVSGLAITSTALPAGQVGVAYSTTPTTTGGAAPLTWTATGLPAGLGINATTGAITGTPTTPTTASVVLTVTDGDGGQASATMPVTIAAAPLKSTTAPAPPIVTKVSQSHATWREGAKLASIAGKRKPPVGTTFTLNVNEAAQVTLTFVLNQPGRKAHGKCVAPSKRNRRGRACLRIRNAGGLTLPGRAGTNTISFQGRLSGSRKLAPGRYTVYVAAFTTAGSSRGIPLKFTIAP